MDEHISIRIGVVVEAVDAATRLNVGMANIKTTAQRASSAMRWKLADPRVTASFYAQHRPQWRAAACEARTFSTLRCPSEALQRYSQCTRFLELRPLVAACSI
ncbi:hypothetical protein AO715_11585 [Xanthomonas sp. Mitacek01]|nr:hypothetical protein AO715_11585 [Xanthomonas sp. Mitacek01]